jgi:hypothetical protein
VGLDVSVGVKLLTGVWVRVGVDVSIGAGAEEAVATGALTGGEVVAALVTVVVRAWCMLAPWQRRGGPLASTP